MCGIFGLCVAPRANLTPHLVRAATDTLFKLSESRGKEAAGLAVQLNGVIAVYKDAVAASRMIRSRAYRAFFQELFPDQADTSRPLVLIGHSRLVTNGRQVFRQNNQPVIKDGLVGVHNGIITNVEQLWQAFPQLERRSEVDTEVLLALIRLYVRRDPSPSLPKAISAAFSHLQGTASVAILAEDYQELALATNNGSLYLSLDSERSLGVFASESYILERFFQDRHLGRQLGGGDIRHLPAQRGIVINPEDLSLQEFGLSTPVAPLSRVRPAPLPIRDTSARDEEARRLLRRCSRCILPETMPFISFDQEGVCNYCRHHQKMAVRGRETLEKAVAPYRSGSGRPECLVMLSGGRDSSYGLHYVRAELGLKAVAYTYDWGVITDLGRRNQARLCGKLGVEHILVSADINRKRRNIRKNIEAWLKRPDLGMVPLFMAGDKQYYYYAHQVARQTGCPLIFVCECPLELTRFKAGFCGVDESQSRIFDISLVKKLRLGFYYARRYLENPAYLNASFLDNVSAFWSSYFLRHDYLFLYRYIEWNEDRIVATLLSEYDWEIDPQAATTWRIGDGTAAFYNYIYYTVAGLSENDTLRSNQIREGVLTREEALRRVERENQPRWHSMEWYAQTIGFDLNEAIQVINAMPKLYLKR